MKGLVGPLVCSALLGAPAFAQSPLHEFLAPVQQNAALVEQSAAAAESLKDQASKLADVMSIFRLDSRVSSTPVKAIRPTVAQKRTPASKPSATVARAQHAQQPAPASNAAASTHASADEWETF